MVAATMPATNAAIDRLLNCWAMLPHLDQQHLARLRVAPEHQISVPDLRKQNLNHKCQEMDLCWGASMSQAQELIERARVFDERAERATDPISRQHYREMAAHYRSLSVEHREATTQSERKPPKRELVNWNRFKVVFDLQIFREWALFPTEIGLFPIFGRSGSLLW
jgi:hypothetical protein